VTESFAKASRNARLIPLEGAGHFELMPASPTCANSPESTSSGSRSLTTFLHGTADSEWSGPQSGAPSLSGSPDRKYARQALP